LPLVAFAFSAAAPCAILSSFSARALSALRIMAIETHAIRETVPGVDMLIEIYSIDGGRVALAGNEGRRRSGQYR
jgi:hypothetical protein